MTETPPHNRMRVGADAAIIRANIDHLSTIRYVHAQSLRAAVLGWGGEKLAQAYVDLAYSTRYAQSIERAIAADRCFAAMIDRQIIGTSGWAPMQDNSPVARIKWCHVLPIFGRVGIGGKLLAIAEAAAAAEGCSTFIVRATPHAVRFFETAGYGVTAHGTLTIGNNETVPVTYLRRSLHAPANATLI